MPDRGSDRIVLDVGRDSEVERTPDLAYGRPIGVDLTMDVYRPSGSSGALPVVFFVHGDADPVHLVGAKRWGQYVSWAEAVASMGVAAVTFDHSSTERLTRLDHVLGEIDQALDFVRTEGPRLGVDANRLALWACSGGVPLALSAVMRRPEVIRCAVALYGPCDLRPMRSLAGTEVPADDLAQASPLALLEDLGLPWPLLCIQAALDRPEINQTIDAFLAACHARGLPAQLLVHEQGHHVFDVRDEGPRSDELIRAILAFLRVHVAS